MANDEERIHILEMIANGQISAAQGIELLDALEEGDDEMVIAPEQESTVGAAKLYPAGQAEEYVRSGNPPPSEFENWKRWWVIPLWVGVGVTILGGLLMELAWLAGGFSFWFACAWFPFLIGVALLAFAWASRNMRWLHVRVDQKSGDWPRRIAFSFPLPLRLATWAVRTFGDYIPQVGGMGLEQMVVALENTSPDSPFYLEVDQEAGEHVQIFIG